MLSITSDWLFISLRYFLLRNTRPTRQLTDAITTLTIRNAFDLKNEITLEEEEIGNDVGTDVGDEEIDETNVDETNRIIDGYHIGTDVSDEENIGSYVGETDACFCSIGDRC